MSEEFVEEHGGRIGDFATLSGAKGGLPRLLCWAAQTDLNITGVEDRNAAVAALGEVRP